MTAEEALARLQRMVAYDQAPTLSDDEVTDLLSLSQLVDSDGLAPSDADWTPTYDLNRGAAEGWRWKAAKVAGLHDYATGGPGGLTVNRSQMHKSCLEQAKAYARRTVTSVACPGQLAREDD